MSNSTHESAEVTAPVTAPNNASANSPDRSVRERRAGTRRSAAVQRAAWMSSRARNAARRGPLIAAAGGVAVIATLLALVLLPREADRLIRAQLETVPASTDTIPLIAALEAARASRSTAAAAVRNGSARAPISPVAAAGVDVELRDSIRPPRDSATVDLAVRLARARGAPLVESYRALADSRVLRDDARVRAIIDSIDQVDREREAYVALGGPDARYATLTARLAALGARVMRIAESALEGSAPTLPSPSSASPTALGVPTAPTAPVASTAPTAPIAAGAVPDSSALATPAVPLLNARPPVADSALITSARAAADSVTRIEQSLDFARRTNGALESRRASLRKLSGVAVPPFAMLLAALVVGLAFGYGSAVIRELRRPTVGDEGEVERIAQARVIIHAGAPVAVRDSRARRRADHARSPVLDPTAEAWQQLHLTLTGHGDVVRAVRIVADQPLFGDTLAINLAAAAARESRATLLIEPPTKSPLLSMLLRQTKPRGMQDVQLGRAELREVITEIPMGRDANVDVLFAGSAVMGGSASEPKTTLQDELRRVSARYDLTLVTGDASSVTGVVTHDVIVCARLGVTSLAWLQNAATQARGGNHRLRAVLLWATDAPSL